MFGDGNKDDDDDGKRKQNGIIEVVDDVNLCIWFVGNQNMIIFLVQNKTKDQTNKQTLASLFQSFGTLIDLHIGFLFDDDNDHHD